MNRPTAIITEPVMTVQRMPELLASRPISSPPTAPPNIDSDTASEGTCRAPPVSEAISFSPTAVIHGPPNDRPSRTSDTLATTQEVRVSIDRASVARVSMGRCSVERDSMPCVVKPVPGGLALKSKGLGGFQSPRPGRIRGATVYPRQGGDK